MSEQKDRFYAQFQALRGEILSLMEANERRIFGAAGFASASWGGLISLLAGGVPVPGVAFLTPSIVLILGLNVHVTYSKRIANISSFLAHALGAVDPDVPNWEKEISEFAQNSRIKMSSRVSVVAIYATLTIVGIVGSVITPLSRVIANGDAPLWSYFDLGGTVALAVFILSNLRIAARDYKNSGSLRLELDAYWRERFAGNKTGAQGGGI